MSFFRVFLAASVVVVGSIASPCPDPALAQGTARIPEMLERVMPGVVTVAVTEMSETKAIFGAAGASPLDTAYRRVLDLSDAKSSGSGFMVEQGGRKYIVTNAHVVESASGTGSIFAYSINQTRYPMRIAGADSFYDIALLEFSGTPPGAELATLAFRGSEPRIGETVLAIGNPLGQYPYSVTSGIIGGKNRFLGGLTGRLGYVQSSATTTWGNSGGPLVDTDGKVVGINTRIEIAGQGDQAFVQSQLNFALDARIAARLVQEILANGGRLRRAFLGLDIEQDVVIGARRVDPGPVVIAGVVPDSPAARALGAKKGFRIDRIGAEVVRNIDEALAALESVRPDATVAIEITSPQGRSETIEIRTAALSEENLMAAAQFLLREKVAAQALPRGGAVYVRSAASRGSNTGAPSPSAQYYPVQKPNIPGVPPKAIPAPQSPELLLIAVGLVRGEERLLYRVANLSQLGAAIKLVAMTGRVDFVLSAGPQSQPVVRSLWLSGRENVAGRTVVY